MIRPPTVGLALIARDEQGTLPELLRSISGVFDEVVLVDTGSRDRTVDVFERWARDERRRTPGFRGVPRSFSWRDNFSAARSFAASQLISEWHAWADADDVAVNAGRLRQLVAAAPKTVSALRMAYVCRESISGQPLAYTRRVRLYRAGAAHWRGRVHETLVLTGGHLDVDLHDAHWSHRPGESWQKESAPRNLRILRDWFEEEPDDPQARKYMGIEEAARGRHQNAIEHFRRFLVLPGTPADARLHVRLELARSLLALGHVSQAVTCAEEAVADSPGSPAAHLMLAEVKLAAGDPRSAVEEARAALRLGPATDGLLFRPVDDRVRPQMIIARALRELGQIGDSVEAGKVALGRALIEPAGD